MTWTLTLFPTGGVSLQICRRSGPPITAPCVPSLVKGAFTVPVEDEVARLGQQIDAALARTHDL